MNFKSRVLKLEEYYYKFKDTSPQHYTLDEKMEAFSSSHHSSVNTQSHDSTLSSTTLHIQFQALVDCNIQLKIKIEKMMNLVTSL